MKTDTQLQQDVLAELRWEPSINAAQIGVEVTDGIVARSGHVGSYGEKRDAESAARCVAGVRELARHSAWGTPGVRSVVDTMAVTF